MCVCVPGHRCVLVQPVSQRGGRLQHPTRSLSSVGRQQVGWAPLCLVPFVEASVEDLMRSIAGIKTCTRVHKRLLVYSFFLYPVSNKWIHERGQEWRRPCALNETEWWPEWSLPPHVLRPCQRPRRQIRQEACTGSKRITPSLRTLSFPHRCYALSPEVVWVNDKPLDIFIFLFLGISMTDYVLWMFDSTPMCPSLWTPFLRWGHPSAVTWNL